MKNDYLAIFKMINVVVRSIFHGILLPLTRETPSGLKGNMKKFTFFVCSAVKSLELNLNTLKARVANTKSKRRYAKDTSALRDEQAEHVLFSVYRLSVQLWRQLDVPNRVVSAKIHSQLVLYLSGCVSSCRQENVK